MGACSTCVGGRTGRQGKWEVCVWEAGLYRTHSDGTRLALLLAHQAWVHPCLPHTDLACSAAFHTRASSRCVSTVIQALRYESKMKDSELAEFLMQRAEKSFELTNNLHWYALLLRWE